MFNAKKRVVSCLLITLSCFALGACAIKLNTPSSDSETENSVKLVDPFKIELSEARLIDGYKEEIPLEGAQSKPPDAKRLRLVVSILNGTAETLEEVRYVIRLNEAAKPFIASAILERQSDAFRVIPQGAQTVGEMSNGYINVTGFEDVWQPLITDEADLLEYFSMTLDDLPEYLQSVTVSITWRGGQQEETLPIVLP